MASASGAVSVAPSQPSSTDAGASSTPLPGDEEGGVGSYAESACRERGGLFHQEQRECIELPDEIAGVGVTKTAGGLDELTSGVGPLASLAPFAEGFLAEEPDAAYAAGVAFGNTTRSSLVAIHAADVSAEELVERLQAAFEDEIPASAWSDATVGGREVLVSTPTSDGRSYLYALDDMVFFFATTEPSAAEDVFGQLP
jgi:hypothetical protein